MIDLDWIGAVEDVQGAARYLVSRGCNKVRYGILSQWYRFEEKNLILHS